MRLEQSRKYVKTGEIGNQRKYRDNQSNDSVKNLQGVNNNILSSSGFCHPGKPQRENEREKIHKYYMCQKQKYQSSMKVMVMLIVDFMVGTVIKVLKVRLNE